MRSIIAALLCLAACGAPAIERPACEAPFDTFEACADSAADYAGQLACRDSRDASLGRASPPADACFATLATCLQSDTIPRRECLQREADCLRAQCADGGAL